MVSIVGAYVEGLPISNSSSFFTRVASLYLGGAVYIFVGLKAFTGAFGAGKVVEYYGAITKLINSCSDIAGCLGIRVSYRKKRYDYNNSSRSRKQRNWQ